MKTKLLTGLCVTCLVANPAAAALINGDFETGDLTGWSSFSFGGQTNNLLIDSVTPLSGSHSMTTDNAGSTANTIRSTTQSFTAFTDFVYTMDFRIDGTSTVREMDWSLGALTGGEANGLIRFGVDNTNGIRGIGINGAAAGAFGSLNGGSFNPVTGVEYTWVLTGSDFDGTSSASYDVEIFQGASSVYTSLNNTFTSASGASIQSVNFTRGGNWGAGAYTVDNIGIAVPEPSSAALVGLAGLALILRRRK